MAVRRLQHVSVPRPPGEAAAAQAVHFYRDILGLEEVPKPITFTEIDTTWFRCGDDEIHLLATDQPFPLQHGGAHFCLVTDDLQAIRELLQREGFPCFENTPIPHRPRFSTRDPFGNGIEITSIEGDYTRP
jgi:catechol 2,3-dioxygenase-like lactoylglutathione lyase family enzyme